MPRPRKQTYTLDMYLKKNRKGDIDNNADVQRNFVWKNEQINELIVTVLTDDYIPPIILGEEEDSRLHIVDGGCRTAALRRFREMNYKITSLLENPMVPYKKKAFSEDGNIAYEDALFDVRNKTYDKLPDELKEKFDEYQIETVIHERCDSHIISKYIKRYNNHVSMNTDQKAFTYIDRFAGRIRKILDSRFFVECSSYTERDKTKGAVERIVVEAMMCMNHFDNWKTQPQAACRYLNEYATDAEFDAFADNLRRLEKIITNDIKEIFNKKDSFLFLTLFDKFTRLNAKDRKFAEFLREFQGQIRFVKRNEKGLLFDEIDKGLSTKDKQVITDKLTMLEKCMEEFLQTKENCCFEQGKIEEFVAQCIGTDAASVREDMDFYQESLDVLLDQAVRIGSVLRDERNRPSMLAMMAYSYREDKDLDAWMAEYAKRHRTFRKDQKKNFACMREDFEKWRG